MGTTISNTKDTRDQAHKIYLDLVAGTISNQSARARLQALKVGLETIKVEIQAAQLGQDFDAVDYDRSTTRVRRIA